MHAELSVHKITNYQYASVRRVFHGLSRSLVERVVRQENIKEDISVNGSDHRPRTSLMNSSTEEYPNAAKLALEWPFHFWILSFLGAFLRSMEPSYDTELHFCLGTKAKLFTDVFWNGYLSTLTDFHTFKYES
jgi:hypothetical protein